MRGSRNFHKGYPGLKCFGNVSFFFFFFTVLVSQKRAIIGPPGKRHSMAFRWRAHDCPTLFTGWVALRFSRVSGPVYPGKPIALRFSFGVRTMSCTLLTNCSMKVYGKVETDIICAVCRCLINVGKKSIQLNQALPRRYSCVYIKHKYWFIDENINVTNKTLHSYVFKWDCKPWSEMQIVHSKPISDRYWGFIHVCHLSL